MTTYTINHPDYGERVTFQTLEAAQESIRDCGGDFEATTLRDDGSRIYDERGVRIGFVQDDDTPNEVR